MSATKDVYRLLSLANLVRALFRGPAALGRYLVRRHAHKALARTMRRAGL